MAVENADCGDGGRENTQSAWKVNSYVLETSGVLMFFFAFLLLRASLFTYELDVIISSLGR